MRIWRLIVPQAIRGWASPKLRPKLSLNSPTLTMTSTSTKIEVGIEVLEAEMEENRKRKQKREGKAAKDSIDYSIPQSYIGKLLR